MVFPKITLSSNSLSTTIKYSCSKHTYYNVNLPEYDNSSYKKYCSSLELCLNSFTQYKDNKLEEKALRVLKHQSNSPNINVYFQNLRQDLFLPSFSVSTLLRLGLVSSICCCGCCGNGLLTPRPYVPCTGVTLGLTF